jgi:hypothetical protein
MKAYVILLNMVSYEVMPESDVLCVFVSNRTTGEMLSTDVVKEYRHGSIINNSEFLSFLLDM